MSSIAFFLACATCQANSSSGGGEATKWSILFLLAIIVGLLIGIGRFMAHLAAGEKQHLDPALSDEYVPDSTR